MSNGVRAVHVYHHNDMDGKMSAAYFFNFIKRYDKSYTRTIFHSIDYSVEIDLENIHKNDMVVFLDYSFSNSKNWEGFINLINKKDNDILWIDHHKTSEDRFEYFLNKTEENEKCDGLDDDCTITKMYDSINGNIFYYNEPKLTVYYTKDYCATYATWVYCHTMLNNIDKNADYELYLDPTKNNVPLMVQYVDSYDCWKMNKPNTHDFNYAMDRYINKPKKVFDKLTYPEDLDIFVENSELRTFEKGIIKTIVSDGKKIHAYLDTRNRSIRCNGGKIEFNIRIGHNFYRCVAMNIHGNSMVFGELYNEYDIVCPFHMLNTNNGCWKYSLFSRLRFENGAKTCEDIAKAIGSTKDAFSGGGHSNAAGFVLKKQIITPGCTININKNIFGNYKIKVHNPY